MDGGAYPAAEGDPARAAKGARDDTDADDYWAPARNAILPAQRILFLILQFF
jgi:hypothetical protein